MGLGFQNAGFPIACSIDIESTAIATSEANIRGHHLIASVEDSYHFLEEHHQHKRTILVGGPPCQAYSRIGQAKLRSLRADPNDIDPRANLYMQYLTVVAKLQPIAVVMENVPAAINYKAKDNKAPINILEETIQHLLELGYTTKWSILNSADYGVPQTRERAFLIGYKTELNCTVKFPMATHHRPKRLKTSFTPSCSQSRLNAFPNYIAPPQHPRPKKLPKWVSVGAAFSDLPNLSSFANGVWTPHPHKNMSLTLPYTCKPETPYQEKMRQKISHEHPVVNANCTRNTERDFPTFAKMKQGDNYLDASRIAEERFARVVEEYNLVPNTQEYERQRKKIVPPYRKDAFEGKWKKLHEEKPSHTVVAHLDTDTYSHIHPWEPRGISVREAARLQSFPDNFQFKCAMGPAFKQIGNAVPPLLAENIAKTIAQTLAERS